jgi:hypothetical protein
MIGSPCYPLSAIFSIPSGMIELMPRNFQITARSGKQLQAADKNDRVYHEKMPISRFTNLTTL